MKAETGGEMKPKKPYREQVRETLQAMSDQALRFQDTVVVGGIDREELNRELTRRGI
jgi:hypothetical protein